MLHFLLIYLSPIYLPKSWQTVEIISAPSFKTTSPLSIILSAYTHCSYLHTVYCTSSHRPCDFFFSGVAKSMPSTTKLQRPSDAAFGSGLINPSRLKFHCSSLFYSFLINLNWIILWKFRSNIEMWVRIASQDFTLTNKQTSMAS